MIAANDFSRKFEIDLHNVCKTSPYGARIVSYYESYHGTKYTFLDFWLQRDECGFACCAFCRYYSTVIICGEPCDISEAEQFVMMLAPISVMCSGELNLDLKMHFIEGETMRCRKLADNKIIAESNCEIQRINSDTRGLRDMYDLLLSVNGNKDALPEFGCFYPDIAHRIRHGTAEVCAVYQDGKMVSTAAIVAKSPDSAVIACVATAFESRSKGYATVLVGDLTKKMLAQGRAVYLHRERKLHLYDRLGFKPCGSWREYNGCLAPK